jgi:hypothetical protein
MAEVYAKLPNLAAAGRGLDGALSTSLRAGSALSPQSLW